MGQAFSRCRRNSDDDHGSATTSARKEIVAAWLDVLNNCVPCQRWDCPAGCRFVLVRTVGVWHATVLATQDVADLLRQLGFRAIGVCHSTTHVLYVGLPDENEKIELLHHEVDPELLGKLSFTLAQVQHVCETQKRMTAPRIAARVAALRDQWLDYLQIEMVAPHRMYDVDAVYEDFALPLPEIDPRNQLTNDEYCDEEIARGKAAADVERILRACGFRIAACYNLYDRILVSCDFDPSHHGAPPPPPPQNGSPDVVVDAVVAQKFSHTPLAIQRMRAERRVAMRARTAERVRALRDQWIAFLNVAMRNADPPIHAFKLPADDTCAPLSDDFDEQQARRRAAKDMCKLLRQDGFFASFARDAPTTLYIYCDLRKHTPNADADADADCGADDDDDGVEWDHSHFTVTRAEILHAAAAFATVDAAHAAHAAATTDSSYCVDTQCIVDCGSADCGSNGGVDCCTDCGAGCDCGGA